jgi:hypothetical protein
MRRRLLASVALFCACAEAFPQTGSSDSEGPALLAKTRALYDAPFTRNLFSIDCAVQFDWKKHVLEAVGSVPLAIAPAVEQLQTVQHRVTADRASGAVVSSVSTTPSQTALPQVAEWEAVFDKIVAGGLNAWMPFGTNVILPTGTTKYAFQHVDTGYKLTLNGEGVDATLLLGSDLRMTSGVSQLPQPMRFSTNFIDGPDGYLLGSVKTASTSDASAAGEATFTYTWQTVQGFQLPSMIIVTPSNPESWRYNLTDCKVATGAVVNVTPPPKAR